MLESYLTDRATAAKLIDEFALLIREASSPEAAAVDIANAIDAFCVSNFGERFFPEGVSDVK